MANSILMLSRGRYIDIDKIDDETYRRALERGISKILDDKTTLVTTKRHIEAAMIDPKAVSSIRRK